MVISGKNPYKAQMTVLESGLAAAMNNGSASSVGGGSAGDRYITPEYLTPLPTSVSCRYHHLILNVIGIYGDMICQRVCVFVCCPETAHG